MRHTHQRSRWLIESPALDDRLVLRAWATIDGERVLYQEGPLGAMRHPEL